MLMKYICLIPTLLKIVSSKQVAAVVAHQSSPVHENTSLDDARPNYYSLHASKSCVVKSSDFCSPWVYCDNGKCKCGEIPYGVLQCSVHMNLSLLGNNCLTYNEDEQLTEIGRCLYTSIKGYSVYTVLPKSISEMDEFMCGKKFNKTGTLCGKCKGGHSQLVYSFDMNCVKCPNGKANWWKYVLVAFLPLTIFYLVVLLFKINVASSRMYPFILYAQAVTTPSSARVELMYLKNDQPSQTAVRWIQMLYGMWNLDFLRSFDLGICLGTDTQQTLALDLAVGVYPLLLMIPTYLLIHLYDHRFKPLVLIWKPFQSISKLFKGKRTTLIDAFCTFFLLSNTKLWNASFDLLVPVLVYQLNSTGNMTYSWRLYNDGSVHYFGQQHLPYAILAIGVLLLFALLPVLLLTLYPFRWFQKILNLFPFRWYILHTFMDSFQGCYKDGTEHGTRDCRWFASVFFIARYIIMFTIVSTFNASYFPLATIVLVFIVIMLVIIQPFKQTAHNVQYTHFMTTFFLAVGHIGALGTSLATQPRLLFPFMVILFIAALLPLLFISATFLHWMYGNRRYGMELLWRLQAWRRGYDRLN